MLTLEEYTQGIVKQAGGKIRFADSLLGKGAKGVSGAALSALDALRAVAKRAPNPEAQQKAVAKFWDSAAGKVLKGTGAVAVGSGKIVGRAFTSKGPDGKRKLNLVKGLMITAPAAGMYHGMERAKMKARQSRFYGQRKPPQLYADPRRRLR